MAKVIGVALQVVGIGLNFVAPGSGVGFIAAGSALLAADGYEQQRRAKRRAIAAYNASLQDRLEMVERDPTLARSLCLGRVRNVDGVLRSFTVGTNNETLVMIVAHAGHEIDGFEQFYFFDTPLTLDAQGYVLTPPYNKLGLESVEVPVTLSSSGTAFVVAVEAPIFSAVKAVQLASGTAPARTLSVSVSGLDITISGGDPSAQAQLSYQWGQSDQTARIRTYTGTAAQNVGADLAAQYPGKITAAERFAGIALSVVELKYDPDVYPQGRPVVTAVLRGARVYDPRKDSTAGGSGAHRLATPSTWEWSENPALLAYHYARHPNGWAVPAADIPLPYIVRAANVCDEIVDFPVTGAPAVTLPRYRAGIVISTAADPRESMNELVEAMAGRHGWAGGTWRLMAGHMPAPVFAMDETWLARRIGVDGGIEPGPTIAFTNGVPRGEKVNRVSGRCVDPAQRWQVLPFPAVEDPVLIAREGSVYPLEVEYQAVNTITHAQHLSRVAIKRGQAPLRATAQCNLFAYPVELFDVGTLTLPRYGIAGKTMDVVGWRWSPAEGPQLELLEITDAIFAADGDLTGRDPAPNTNLPSPWLVEEVQGLAVTSGTTELVDGSVLTRTLVRWDPALSPNIAVGGKVVIEFALVEDGPARWQLWEEEGSQVQAVIPGLLSGSFYLFRARFRSGPPLAVRGPWCPQVLHQVAVPAGGGAGLSSYMIEIYTQAATQPATPQGGQYTFVGDVFVPPAGGWSRDQPNGSETPTWASRYLVQTATPDVPFDIPVGGSPSIVGNFWMQSLGDPSEPIPAHAAGDIVFALLQTANTAAGLPGTPSGYTSLLSHVPTFGRPWRLVYAVDADNSLTSFAPGAALPGSGWAYWGFVVTGASGIGASGLTPESGTSPSTALPLPTLAIGAGSLVVAGALSNQAGSLSVPSGMSLVIDSRPPGFTGQGSPLWISSAAESSFSGRQTFSTVSAVASGWAVELLPGVAAWSVPNKHVQDGQGGAVLYITATSQTFTFGASGLPVPASQTITFTAVATTLAGSPVFTATLFDAAGASLGPATLGGTGTSRTLTVANFGSAQRVVVVVTQDGYTDQITVVRLRDGAGNVAGYLTNESAIVDAAADGTVSSFDGAGGTFVVFDGLTPVTGGASVTYSVQSETGVDVSIASTGVYTVNSMSANAGNATLRAVYSGVTLDKVYSIAKSRQGQAGPPALSATLSTYVVLFRSDSEGVVEPGQSFDVTMTVMVGSTDDTSAWTITRASSDASITTSIAGATVTITGIGDALEAGSVAITATKAGAPTQTLICNVGKLKAGGLPLGLQPNLNGLVSNNVATVGTASASLIFDTEGRTRDHTGLYGPDYFRPPAGGVGAGLWLRVTKLDGTAMSGPVDSWVSLATERTYTVERSTIGVSTAAIAFEIATNDVGAGFTLRGTATITAERE